MILVSTHAKMVAKDAIIYRVDFPKFEALGIVVEKSHEHFATKKQAQHAAESYFPSMVTGTVSAVSASSFDPWADR